MNELKLYREIMKLSEIAEEIGCQPIQEDLIQTAKYLKEFIDES
tara:strand:- start:281 stop:412 length:132 start_codon:yes stop_codon:yes gene_type:complete